MLKGTGTAAPDDLPKKLEAYIEVDGDKTNLRLLVRATHRMGTWGAEDKYEDELSSFADRVVTARRSSMPTIVPGRLESSTTTSGVALRFEARLADSVNAGGARG